MSSPFLKYAICRLTLHSHEDYLVRSPAPPLSQAQGGNDTARASETTRPKKKRRIARMISAQARMVLMKPVASNNPSLPRCPPLLPPSPPPASKRRGSVCLEENTRGGNFLDELERPGCAVGPSRIALLSCVTTASVARRDAMLSPPTRGWGDWAPATPEGPYKPITKLINPKSLNA